MVNDSAFLLHEQKMVDSLMCCDAISFALPGATIIVMSNDLDVLPAVALGATLNQGQTVLVRGDSADDGLYGRELNALGVLSETWGLE